MIKTCIISKICQIESVEMLVWSENDSVYFNPSPFFNFSISTMSIRHIAALRWFCGCIFVDNRCTMSKQFNDPVSMHTQIRLNLQKNTFYVWQRLRAPWLKLNDSVSPKSLQASVSEDMSKVTDVNKAPWQHQLGWQHKGDGRYGNGFAIMRLVTAELNYRVSPHVCLQKSHWIWLELFN